MIDGSMASTEKSASRQADRPRPVPLVVLHLTIQIDKAFRPVVGFVEQTRRPTTVKFTHCCRGFEESAPPVHRGKTPPWKTLPASYLGTFYTLAILEHVCSVFSHCYSNLTMDPFRNTPCQLTPTERGGYFDTRPGSDESRVS